MSIEKAKALLSGVDSAKAVSGKAKEIEISVLQSHVANAMNSAMMNLIGKFPQHEQYIRKTYGL